MHITDYLWQRLQALLPGELAPHEASGLIRPCGHMPLMQQRRARMIINRVRLFATLFAILTPLWIAVDTLTLPFPLWLELAALRLVATLAFVALIVWCPQESRLRSAYRGMATLFAIPTLFFVASHLLLSHYQLAGVSAAIGTGYAFLPFVLLAGFAIFPLTLLENLAFAMPMLAAFALAGLMNLSVASWPSHSGQFWLLTLLTGVASLASMSQLAFIIALVNQAIRDPLTGTFSRRSGKELLELQMVFARRNQTPLSVAFIDLDHFKSINDNFGHEAGDKVLQQLAPAVAQCMRSGDILVRWGGEEFLLLMPGANLAQAEQALQRLRLYGLGNRPDGQPQTASIGLAEWQADETDDWHQLVELADERMYQAKQGGRDRIVSHH